MKKFLMEKLNMMDMDWIKIGKAYLSGVIGALTVYGIMHFFDAKPFRIGTVNITAMVDKFVRQEASKNLSPEKMKTEVASFGRNLESELRKFSHIHHVVLLPSEAVIAGALDYTKIVRQEMNRKTGQEELPDAG